MAEEEIDLKSNSGDEIIPRTATTEFVGETESTGATQNIQIATTDLVTKEPIQVIVNIPKEESKTATIANRIAILGTAINLILAFLTYMLFQKTVEANKTSQLSLAEAQNAVNQARRANDIAEANFKLAQISTASNDSINDLNLQLSRKSLGTQIKSVEETQKQFETANMPFLQCTNFNFKSFEPEKPIIINFKTENLGNYPAKITERTFGYICSPPPLPQNPIAKNGKSIGSEFWSSYVNKEKPTTENFTSKVKISQSAYDEIMNGKLILGFFGDIKYFNETTGKKRVYKFYVHIYPPPSSEYKIIHNKNKDID